MKFVLIELSINHTYSAIFQATILMLLIALNRMQKNKLLLVNIPYLSSKYKVFNDFGDVKLSDVSPKKFLSLIKYSHCVFTDSFHACVFSYIYEKIFLLSKEVRKMSLALDLKIFYH